MVDVPYSPDETMAVVLSGVLSLNWAWWYRDLRAGSKLGERTASRALGVVPLVALAVLFVILACWAASDVRSSGAYLFQYVAMGAAWLGVAVRFLSWLGISARDDVAERSNRAAATALSGALLGITLCYAGGNVGDGPGWWVVVFSSGLATLGFFAMWGVLETAAHPSDAITIDRDPAAGARLAAFFVAEGLILGRAVAGDWVSDVATLRDLAVRGWPALVVLVLAIVLERMLRPDGDVPRRSIVASGVVPGALLLAVAATWLAYLGAAT